MLKVLKINIKQVGFTIVELITVIIILSILAGTAIPKYIKLSTEANLSTIQAMGGAILSSANLVYAKSVIQGVQNQPSANVDLDNDGIDDLAVEFGYPNGTRDNGIAKMMGGEIFPPAGLGLLMPAVVFFGLLQQHLANA